jgi:hypothetical protein
MNTSDFTVVSKNTIDFLSLHDCVSKHIFFKDGMIVFEMDWMEVLSSHPDNPYGESHQSDNGQIILFNPIKKKLDFPCACDWKQAELMSLLPIEQFDFINCTILEFNEAPIDKGYSSYILSYNDSNPFIEMTIEYSESLVKWNQLGANSWFEDGKWKK